MEVDITEKISRFIEGFQAIFSLRRTKITLYVAAVLWIAVFTQIVMNRVFFNSFEIAEAFVKTNTEDMECNIEVIAQHHSEFLSESDKKDILHHLANSIGLDINSDISIVCEGEKTEYSYYKLAKKAETSIKIVSIQEEIDTDIRIRHYIVVRLNIKESINSIKKYRKLIEESLDGLNIRERQVNVLYEGLVDGLMSKADKEEMASLLVKDLQGEVAFDYQQGESYTVYAYTGLIDEYIETVGCKINIQIAMTYDELLEKTKIYLATPIINQSW
jgi:hypothetical protein